MPNWGNEEKAKETWMFVTTAEEWVRRSGLAPVFADVAFNNAPQVGGAWMPIRIHSPGMLVKKMYVLNGTVVSGLASLNLLRFYSDFTAETFPGAGFISLTTGVFAQVGTSVWQGVAVQNGPVFLPPGDYAMSFTADNTTTKTLCMKAVGFSAEAGFWGIWYGSQFPGWDGIIGGGGTTPPGFPLLALGGVA